MSPIVPVAVTFALMTVALPLIEPAAGQTPGLDGEACVRTSLLPPTALRPETVELAVSS